MKLILLEHGQVMLYLDTLLMTILKIGIGVILVMVIGTTNHSLRIKHEMTSLLALLAVHQLNKCLR